MQHFHQDVIRSSDALPPATRQDYEAENAKINDLGWSYDQRRAAIEEITARHSLEGAKATEIASKPDSYLRARIEILRTLNGQPSGTSARAEPASIRGDAAAEAEAYARSVARLNSWRNEKAASAPAQRASATPSRGDATTEAEAYARSVANLNSWRDRA